MIEEISQYLEGAEHDFSQGFALFCKYSRNDCLMSWISRKRDMEKLLYELKKLSDMASDTNPQASINIARYGARIAEQESNTPVTQPVNEDEPEKHSYKTYDDRKTRRSDLPENLQKVYDRISEDYKLRRGLHEKMKMATSDTDRASFRARIIETDGRIRGGWDEIDSYLTRKAQEEEKAKADDFKESTARSYISKALKKANISEAQKVTIKARYEALLSHGCSVGEETVKQLKEKGIL